MPMLQSFEVLVREDKMVTSPWFFATDLHGNRDRYDKLFSCICNENPAAVLLGGDLLPREVWSEADTADFLEYLASSFRRLNDLLAGDYPRVFLILGNDDPRCSEPFFENAVSGIWDYIHNRRLLWNGYTIYGYACVPPTPFLLKDWERYDVSRYVAPGCVSPEEGRHTLPIEPRETKWGTIKEDLENLVGDDDLSRAICLFHTPPADTALDLAALAGKRYEHVPLDPHVGSIAVARFIEQRQPLLTLHGHVHESTRLSGEWKVRIGRTVCINGAHDGPELALVRFDPASPDEATRELI
jgi:Icc-related predicted phosphoesterase